MPILPLRGEMGCILVRIFDPTPPDPAIRAFWHVDGLIVDAIDSLISRSRSQKQTSEVSLDVNRAVTSSTPLTKTQSNSHIARMARLGSVQRRPAGVLYVYNGRLIYRSRKCCARKRPLHPLQIDIREIEYVNYYDKFTSHRSCKTYPGHTVDLIISSNSQSYHVGFFAREAEEISRELSETCVRHRCKPKIFQFNSVDVEGVEIDLP